MLIVTLINLFITSGSAQLALMAPVVVPMMMYVGIAPDVTVLRVRTHLSSALVQDGRCGTLVSLVLSYTVCMLLG